MVASSKKHSILKIYRFPGVYYTSLCWCAICNLIFAPIGLSLFLLAVVPIGLEKTIFLRKIAICFSIYAFIENLTNSNCLVISSNKLTVFKRRLLIFKKPHVEIMLENIKNVVVKEGKYPENPKDPCKIDKRIFCSWIEIEEKKKDETRNAIINGSYNDVTKIASLVSHFFLEKNIQIPIEDRR